MRTYSYFLWVASMAVGFLVAAHASSLVITSAMPNTLDDANLEYVDIENVSCSPFFLSGTVLRDASGKQFIFGDESLGSGSIRRMYRPESKITLNNENETLELLSSTWARLDAISYATSSKGVAISFSGHEVSVCEIPADEEAVIEEPVETWSETAGDPSLENDGTWTEAISSEAEETGSGSVDVESTEGSDNNANAQTTDSTGSEVHDVEVSSSWSSSGPASDAPPAPPAVYSSASSALLPIVPTKLIIEDLDSNERIDRVSVQYSGLLTGSLNGAYLRLYSRSGWLSSSRIEAFTGIVEHIYLSWNLLVLDLYEQDLIHTGLHITTGTDSDLRLKTLSGFGLKGLQWETVEALTYTKSFSSYAKESIENRAYVPQLEEAENTQDTATTGSGVQTTISQYKILKPLTKKQVQALFRASESVFHPIVSVFSKTEDVLEARVWSALSPATIDNSTWKNTVSPAKAQLWSWSTKKAATKKPVVQKKATPKKASTKKASPAETAVSKSKTANRNSSLVPTAYASKKWDASSAEASMPLDMAFGGGIAILAGMSGYMVARRREGVAV